MQAVYRNLDNMKIKKIKSQKASTCKIQKNNQNIRKGGTKKIVHLIRIQ